VNPKQPAGPAMTLGNMRRLGVQRLLASCLNDACRHTALVDVSKYPEDTEVPRFRTRVGELEAAAVPEHVRMYSERHTGSLAKPRHHLPEP